MRSAYPLAAATTRPLRNWIIGRFAWSLSVASILLALAAFAIALRAAILTGDYQTILSHHSLTPLVTIGYAVIGALVAARHPRNLLGWLFLSVAFLYSVGALASAITSYAIAFERVHRIAGWLNNWLWIPGIILPTTFVLFVFPDGRLLSSRWRLIAWSAALGLALTVLSVMFHPGPLETWGLVSNAFGIPVLAPVLDLSVNFGTALLFIGLIGSLVGFSVRFRRSSGLEREQMKWLAYAGGLLLFGFILGSAAWFFWPDNPLMNEISIVITNLTILGIAVAAAIAILRYRLYDIDLIINRTLVYAALTLAILALYILLVGGLGVLFQARGNLLLSLVATGLAAILFQPLRERLQRSVNRLMYGERDEPYAVLSRLSRRLEASLVPEAILPTVVETIAQALKLPYVAIALKESAGFKVAASYGLSVGGTNQFPLVYQGDTLGRLLLAPRGPNEVFTEAEQRLLEDVAHHIGVAAHAVRLTRQLRQLAADLQRSRERLVTAQEEERLRLRRDLHDGLGPVLASQGLKLAALQQLVERDPAVAAGLLEDLIAQNEGVVAEIRRLVYDLRPPALDELGLVEAVRDQVLLISEDSKLYSRLQIRVEEPASGLPPLSAAVEVAAYRIALEAITNVIRHAQADTCLARFSLDGGRSGSALRLEICDDGAGLPEPYRPGIGLNSMKERAEEVGGNCVIESLEQGGTRVLVRLPLSQ